MTAGDNFASLELDDDVSRIPRTPDPAEVPALVRELVRITGQHGRAIRTMRQLVWGVVIAVMLGSLGVVASVAGAALWLGARLERGESVEQRVQRLEARADREER